MARALKDSNLGTRQARARLEVRGKPHWRDVEEGLHIGYRKLAGKAGKWVVRFYTGNREAPYTTETIASADDLSDADGVHILSFTQAVNKARELRARQGNGGRLGPYTVAQCLADYFASRRAQNGDSPSLRGDEQRIANHVLPVFGDMECAKLDRDSLQDWLHQIPSKPALKRSIQGERQFRALDNSPDAIRGRKCSANKVWLIFRAALNHGHDRKKIASQDAWNAVEPFKNVAKPRLVYLNTEQVSRLLNAIDPEYRDIVQVGLAAGARYGDIIAMRVQDFDPDSGTVAVHQGKTRRLVRIILTKNGIELFKRLCAGKASDDLILRRANGEPFRASNLQRPMAEACRIAKIKPAVSFHALRHTYASLARMNHVPDAVIAQNLGHVDTRMVQRTYGHIGEDFAKQMIRERAPDFNFHIDRKVRSI
jgi:integrase